MPNPNINFSTTAVCNKVKCNLELAMMASEVLANHWSKDTSQLKTMHWENEFKPFVKAKCWSSRVTVRTPCSCQTKIVQSLTRISWASTSAALSCHITSLSRISLLLMVCPTLVWTWSFYVGTWPCLYFSKAIWIYIGSRMMHWRAFICDDIK